MRNDGSAMLMQALGNFRPQLPGAGGDGGLAQAAMYRSKDLDRDALGAFQTVAGAHEHRAGLRTQEDMQRAALANALQREGMGNQTALSLQGMRNQGRMDELGVTDPTVRRGQDMSLEGQKYGYDATERWRISQNEALRERERARAAAAKAAAGPKAVKPHQATVFKNVEGGITRILTELEKPETWNQVDPKMRAQAQAQASGRLNTIVNTARMLNARYDAAMQRGDQDGAARALGEVESFFRDSVLPFDAQLQALTSGAPARPMEQGPQFSPDSPLAD
jgi:hypothetical protein